MTGGAGTPAGGGFTVDDLLQAAGPDLFDLLTAPAGTDVRIRRVVIHDPCAPTPVEVGDVVLAVGVSADDPPGVAAFLEGMAAQGASAAVVRGGSPRSWDAMTAAAPLAVVRAPAELSWDDVHVMLRSVLASVEEAPEAGSAWSPRSDLFGAANAISRHVGGAVTIEDQQSRVLAYSTLGHPVDEPRQQAILTGRVADEWLRRLRDEGFLTTLLASREPVRMPPRDGLLGRLAMVVRAGDEPLGFVWVIEGDTPLDEAAFAEASRIAVLPLARHRLGASVERRVESDLVRWLIEGRGAALESISRLGLDERDHLSVVAFRAGPLDPAERDFRHGRLVELVAMFCHSYRRRAWFTTLGETVYAVLSSRSAVQAASITRLVEDLAGQAQQALGLAVIAGIGGTVADHADVPRSRGEADRVLDILTTYQLARPVATIDELATYVVLDQVRTALRAQAPLPLGKVAALAAHDEESGTDYIPTLRAFLNTFGDVSRAAGSLHVHQNTFRYRMRRIAELIAFDPTDAADRLAIELQLTLLDLERRRPDDKDHRR